MEITGYIFLVILGTSIVTFIPRVVPLMLLSKMEIPEWGINWLKHVPVAVMAALLAQELLLSEQVFFSIKENALNLAAAIPTFIVAIFTRSLLVTVLIGVLSLMVMRFFF
ncbi:AzlD domain-containing protein [Peribacillus butanolivorans]|uniref:AzlD domain-containing protein n=1 Tax=Peribacillus butanolivorans TaxID=421767 RepID=UPI0037FF8814